MSLRLPIGLGELVPALEKAHGAPPRPIPRTPFQWVLWENVAYLVADEVRAGAFRELEKRVGFDPRASSAAAT